MRIGELLVAEGLLSEKQLAEALEIQGKNGGRIVEICIAESFFDAPAFLRFLANTRTSASIDLLNYAIPREVIDLIPPHFATKHQVLPIDKMGRLLTVGMACPLDTATITEMEAMTGSKIKPVLVGMNDVKVAIERYYGKAPSVNVDKIPQMSANVGKSSFAFQPPAGAAPAASPAPAAAVTAAPAPVLDKAESGIRMEGVIQLVRRLHSLPALPETVSKVRALADDPKADARAVERAIETDPAVVAKVLGLANAASMGFKHDVDTLEAATRLLGIRDIYNVVLSATVIDYFQASNHFDYRRFWRHSRFCATAARVISEHTKIGTPSVLYVTGLLHGLGRVALAEIVPERYREVDQEAPIATMLNQEESMFGIAHPEVGYMLADIWELPEDISIPIRYHRSLSQATEYREFSAIVGLAAIMTDAYGKVTKDNVRELAATCREAMSILNLPEASFIQVLGATGKLFKEREAGFNPAS